MMLNKKVADCCGCSACYAVCPVQAITMAPNEEGFLYPSVDAKKCISCGLCEKACAFHENYAKASDSVETEIYAFISKDANVRKKSRSGGAFYTMAKIFLDEGGIVYGVALDKEHRAYTKRVEAQSELPSLQGSKYVQSDKENSFRNVKKDLDEGKAVFFGGTACEVSGLHSYLQHTHTNTENFYSCDLICHGIPSPLLWKDNVAMMQKKLGGPIDEISFRDKCFGWHPHIESYRSGNKIRYSNRYTSLFYSHVSMRPSCGVCHYCNFDRCGDVTVSDFWGVEQLNLSENTEKGISMLMVHTHKGQAILQKVKENSIVVPAASSHAVQPNLYHPTPSARDREQFWQYYQKHGYEKTSNHYYPFIDRLKLVYNYYFRRKKH